LTKVITIEKSWPFLFLALKMRVDHFFPLLWLLSEQITNMMGLPEIIKIGKLTVDNLTLIIRPLGQKSFKV